MTALSLDPASLAGWLARREPVYRVRPPHYLVTMLSDLAAHWDPTHRRLLDVGGGTGLIAQCIAETFGVPEVEAVDVVDRFRPDLTIGHRTFDGATLPFADSSFDAATLMNVLHHVPAAQRVPLLAEMRRVVGDGPVYVKDHLSAGLVDDWRLTALDAIGNLPFGGMVSASYLRREDWEELARATGQRIAAVRSGPYRGGAMAALFPNRLEIAFRLERA